MGYTHYWYQNELPEKEFKDFTYAVRNLLEATDIPIVGGFGDPGTQPVITSELVSFNGLEDDSHETFYFQRIPDARGFSSRKDYAGFNFCKTARKPYDIVAVAALCIADVIFEGHIEISSDGMPEEWAEGLEFAKEIFPTARIPATVVEHPVHV